MKRHYERNGYMLKGKLKKRGYDWWWHNFVAIKRSTGEKTPIFIQYMVMNPQISPDVAILGQLEENRERGLLPSYALMRVGCWGKNKKHILKFYPSTVFKADSHRMNVNIADNIASESELKGHLLVTEGEALAQKEYNADYGEMAWDLKAHKQLSYSVGFGASRIFRALNAFAMYWHVQGMKVKYEGTISLDGEIYDVLPESSYGYQDKNWGQEYTNPWIWIGCNNFISDKTGKRLDLTSLDVGGGAPVIFGKKMRGGLLVVFYLEGVLYEFNFSKLWRGEKQEFSYNETDEKIDWHVTAWNRKNKIVLNFSCNKDEMVRTDPEGTNGERNHRDLHNGGTGSGFVELYSKKGSSWELIDRFKGEDAGVELGK